MNKSILEALMRLFAILAAAGKKGLSGEAREIVKSYLKRQFTKELVSRYLSLFNIYLQQYENEQNAQEQNNGKQDVTNSIRILNICKQINEELEQHQKLLVVIELFEFARENYELSKRELSFIETVAVTFKIEKEILKNINAFVRVSTDGLIESENFLLIDNNASYPYSKVKHVFHSTLTGQIIVLHLKNVNVFVFRYIGNRNIYLNGHNIKANRSYVLAVGSVIKGSRLNTIYYGSVAERFIQASSKSKIYYIAENVEYDFKDGIKGLHKFSFSEESGHFVGIIGGSGVGKSTLLNVLNGDLPLKNGKITINGFDLHSDKEKLEGVVGFVPQDDLLIEELTVFQNLYYNARLCFSKCTKEQLVKLVDNSLKDFDLWEARDLKVGNPLNKIISGGQRKRLNIALELIRQPSILFVDEPTSGLSSVDAEKVIFLLKRQTIRGRMVIANIHQPSSDNYKQFDRLLLLDKGGRIIYNGNPIDANVYFKTLSNHVNANERECQTCGNVNAEEPLRIVEARMVNEYGKLTRIRKVKPEEWYEQYQTKIEPEKNKDLEKRKKITQYEKIFDNNFKVPNRFKQFKIFSIRNILSKLGNRQYLLINFLEAPLLATILAYFTKYVSGTANNPDAFIFAGNKNFPVYLFMSVLVALFMGLTVSADEIIKDRRILKREAFLNLSRISYLSSKIMVLFFISAIQAFTYVLIGNYILGVEGMFWKYWLILFATSSLANMVGLNISAGLNSVVNIYILIPFILVPQILLSGVIINFNDLNRTFTANTYVPMAGDLMTSRWAYEAIAVEQFKNNNYRKHFFKYDQQIYNANYNYTYCLPELLSKLEYCEKAISNSNEGERLELNLAIIRNELTMLKSVYALPLFNEINMLVPKKFNFDVSDKCEKHIGLLRKLLIEIKKEANSEKELLFRKLKDSLGQDKLYDLKLRYENKSLSDYMLNKYDMKAFVEAGERLLRRKSPVYMLPESNFGRAHFYSPVKIVFGKKFDTYWFNFSIIWLTSTLLFITLYYDVLRRILVRANRKIK